MCASASVGGSELIHDREITCGAVLALWGLPQSDELYAHAAKVAEAINEELITGHERRARLVPPLTRIH